MRITYKSRNTANNQMMMGSKGKRGCLTTDTNVAAPWFSSLLFAKGAGWTNSWFVILAPWLSSARRAAEYMEFWEANSIGMLAGEIPLWMLFLILSGGNAAPPTLANFDWLFGLSTAVNFFSVSVLLSKSEVLFIVTLERRKTWFRFIANSANSQWSAILRGKLT